MANLAAGDQKGAGIALFSVGGNIGFALGPIVASIALAFCGLKGTAIFLVPALAMPLALFVFRKTVKSLSAESGRRKAAGKTGDNEDDWRSFFKVAACVTSRAVVSYGLTTFIPLYFAAVLLLSESSASATLALYSLAAATATLFGGQAADRVGFLRIIRGGFLLLVPLILVFPLVHSAPLAILLLIPMAMAVNAPLGASIALGQKFLPNHIGTSSGIMLGLAVSVGGMVAPGIGWIGDRYGLTMAMHAVGGFAVLTMALAFLIPDPERKRRKETGDTGEKRGQG